MRAPEDPRISRLQAGEYVNPEQRNGAAIVLRMIVADLQAKVSAPQHYTERERLHNNRMLDIRQQELAALEENTTEVPNEHAQ